MGLKTARRRFGGLRSANIAWLHPRISARARILSRTSAQPPQSRPELSGGPESLTPVAGTLASVQSPTEPNAERRVHTPEATQIAQIRRSATDRANKPTGAQRRRVGARLSGRWRGLSAVPVWPIEWSPVLYIYTSPSLGRMSASAAMRYVGIIESPAGRACHEDSPADYAA
jgi:hypothetical protein